jgi:hypothetical protein
MIERSRDWNGGGGNWIEVLPCIAVSGPPQVSDVPSSYQLHVGEAWARVYCTGETMSFDDVETLTDNGTLHTYTIRGYSPGDSAEKAAAIEPITQRGRVLVRFRDNAGLTRLIGTPTAGLEFTYKLTTDDQVAGSRGYFLTIAGALTDPCQYE